jgi:hypothetical protein
MNNLEALQLASEIMKTELNNMIGTKQYNKLKLAYETMEQMINVETEKDMEDWNMMVAFLDWLNEYNDNYFAYNIKKKMDNNVEKGDIEELVEILNDEEKTFCYERLEDFLIHKDMNCEREESVIVCSLLDWFY